MEAPADAAPSPVPSPGELTVPWACSAVPRQGSKHPHAWQPDYSGSIRRRVYQSGFSREAEAMDGCVCVGELGNGPHNSGCKSKTHGGWGRWGRVDGTQSQGRLQAEPLFPGGNLSRPSVEESLSLLVQGPRTPCGGKFTQSLKHLGNPCTDTPGSAFDNTPGAVGWPR